MLQQKVYCPHQQGDKLFMMSPILVLTDGIISDPVMQSRFLKFFIGAFNPFFSSPPLLIIMKHTGFAVCSATAHRMLRAVINAAALQE